MWFRNYYFFHWLVPDQLIRTEPAQEHVHCIFNEGANHKYRVVFCVENHVRPTSQRTRFQRTKKRCSYSFVSFVSRCRAFVCNSCFRQELRRAFFFLLRVDSRSLPVSYQLYPYERISPPQKAKNVPRTELKFHIFNDFDKSHGV